MAALRLEDDYFTLDLVFPNHNSKKKNLVFPKLFVATFRSLELQERTSSVSASQERSSLSPLVGWGTMRLSH